MSSLKLAVLVLVLCVSTGFGLYSVPKIKPHKSWPKLNEKPLLLTPYILNGSLEEGRKQAKVVPLMGNVESYAGFFTVNKTYNSNMFFWFFPAETDYEHAPVVVWLQGGPGGSSLAGLLLENGPFQLVDELNITLRNHTWTKRCSMLYIDNPVGTGYSFTDDPAGYSQTEDEVGQNLYETVRQFFQLFPKLQPNDFFITGESYAGKYVPVLAYTIHTKNQNSKVRINLRGLAIGNGWCDPVNQMEYGSYLYQLGLIDTNGKELFDKARQEIVVYVQRGLYRKALDVWNSIISDLTTQPTLFTNLTGLTNLYNYVNGNDPLPNFATFLSQPHVRKSIHVGDAVFNSADTVLEHLMNDIMQSAVDPYIQTVIENYRMLLYNGQLDTIVAYPLTVSFVKKLNWTGAAEYKVAPRHIWRVGETIAGYCKSVKNFTEVLVRNAGHLVPMDQPLFAYDLINRFVFDQSCW